MAGKGTKPGANHPWRRSACSKVVKWAREQSEVREVNTVAVARPATLSDRRRKQKPSQI